MPVTRTVATNILRTSYLIPAPTLQSFNAVVPPGERSQVIGSFMQQALAMKERELEAIAVTFMNDPANTEAIADEKLWDVTIGDVLKVYQYNCYSKLVFVVKKAIIFML